MGKKVDKKLLNFVQSMLSSKGISVKLEKDTYFEIEQDSLFRKIKVCNVIEFDSQHYVKIFLKKGIIRKACPKFSKVSRLKKAPKIITEQMIRINSKGFLDSGDWKQMTDIKSFVSDDKVIRGHLLLQKFQEHINLIKSHKGQFGKEVEHFFGRGNKFNIFLQFQYANSKQYEYAEKTVSMSQCYKWIYTIEPIFLNDIDKVPMGNRILFEGEFVDKSGVTYVRTFHRFIPNLPNWQLDVSDYREFLKTGTLKYQNQYINYI